jgi:hypothetical protein
MALTLDFIAYHQGSILLKHPSLHDFRPPCDKPQVINKRYETSKARAERIEGESKRAILEKLMFNEREPNRKYYLRQRENL